MKIVFFGTPDFVVPILDQLNKTHQVIGVVTMPDQIDKKKNLTPTPVKKYALENNIPVFPTTDFGQSQPDFFITAAYGKIIPQKILEIPKYGSINVHPSLLPLYRGPSPITAAILNSDKKTGVSIMQMDQEMDHGPILKQFEHLIKPIDTFETLAFKLFQIAADNLPDILNKFAQGKIKTETQDHKKATFVKLITKKDGYFDLSTIENLNSELEIKNWKLEIDRKIRAYYPWPTAWTILKTKNKNLRTKFLPGEKFQVEGKKPVSLKDFLNGYPEMRDILKKLF